MSRDSATNQLNEYKNTLTVSKIYFILFNILNNKLSIKYAII